MKAILFDLDGTLIDGTEGIVDSFNVAFNEFNLPNPDEKKVCSLIGHPLEVMFEGLGVKKEDVNRYVDAYKVHYRKISRQKTKFLPDAIEAIKFASSLVPIGVVTTKTSIYSEDILEYFGVLKYFDVVIGRNDVQNPKPHAEPILKALERLELTPSRDIYMIGDTCLDMGSAKAAGVNSIALTCGYAPEEVLKKCASNIHKNAFEAVKYLSANV